MQGRDVVGFDAQLVVGVAQRQPYLLADEICYTNAKFTTQMQQNVPHKCRIYCTNVSKFTTRKVGLGA